MADRALRDGGDADHVLRRGRQPLEAADHRVAQRGGQLAPAVGRGREQLLGVERVALRARVQAVGQVGVGLVVQDAGQLLGHLGAGEALERDPLDARGALELGEDGPKRVAAVQLVGAVGREHEERLGACVADEEDEEVARGGVGPVEVLDHQRERAEAVEQREQRLEHLRLARRVGNRLAERPQRVDERRVGEGAAAELQAVADENGYAGPRLELRHEAALADPRLARHERERGRPRRRRLEHRQLVGAPDERGAGDAPEHDLRDGGRARGERAHRPAPLTRSRPGTGEEEAPRRSPRVKRPPPNAAEAAGSRGGVDPVLDELGGDDACVERMHAGQATAETPASHREVAPT